MMSNRDFWTRIGITAVLALAVCAVVFAYTENVWKAITAYEGILIGTLLFWGTIYLAQRYAAARFLAKKAKWNDQALTAVMLANEMSQYHTSDAASKVSAYHDNVFEIEAEGIKRGYIKGEK